MMPWLTRIFSSDDSESKGEEPNADDDAAWPDDSPLDLSEAVPLCGPDEHPLTDAPLDGE